MKAAKGVAMVASKAIEAAIRAVAEALGALDAAPGGSAANLTSSCTALNRASTQFHFAASKPQAEIAAKAGELAQATIAFIGVCASVMAGLGAGEAASEEEAKQTFLGGITDAVRALIVQMQTMDTARSDMSALNDASRGVSVALLAVQSLATVRGLCGLCRSPLPTVAV